MLPTPRVVALVGPCKRVKMTGRRIESVTSLNGATYRGRMFIDATYVGDLMASAAVTYTVGREAEQQYGEDLAGVRRGDAEPRAHYTQGDKDHFVCDVDPYIRPGDPASGLLPLVFKNKADYKIAVQGDSLLFNQYGITLINTAKCPLVKAAAAKRFVDWLRSSVGQQAIADYRIGGQQLFFPNAAGR